MAVNVFMKTCRGEFTGIFAELDGRTVALYLSGGEKLVFPANQVDVTADRPEVEIRVRPRRSALERLRLVMSWVSGHTDADNHKPKGPRRRQP